MTKRCKVRIIDADGTDRCVETEFDSDETIAHLTQRIENQEKIIAGKRYVGVTGLDDIIQFMKERNDTSRTAYITDRVDGKLVRTYKIKVKKLSY